MSLRSLLRQSALYTIGSVVPKLSALILLPVYVRFLSQADYGALALLTSLAGILTVVYRLGIDGALMRLHFDMEGPAQARLYSTATLFSLAVGIGLTLVLAVSLGPFFETLFAGIPFIPMGGLALLVAFAASMEYVPSTLFRATGHAGAFLAVNLGAFLLSSAVSVVLVVVVGLGAAGVLTAQLIAATAVLAVTFILVGRLGPWTFNAAQLRDALEIGLPLVPHGLSAWALRLADRWLIVLLIGLPAIEARSQVGVYSVGYQLGFVVSIVITSFNSAWSPYFFRVGDREHGPRLYTEMTTIVMGGLLVLAVGVSAMAPEIVAIVARPDYEAAADVLPIIAFASVFQGLYTMFVTVVFLTKRTGRLAAITTASAALNLALNVVLIPQMGILGAAWATLAAYTFFAAATYLLARGLYQVTIDWMRLVFVGGTGVAVVLATRLIAPEASLVSGIVHLLLALAFLGLVVAVVWRPLDRLRRVSRTIPAGP